MTEKRAKYIKKMAGGLGRSAGKIRKEMIEEILRQEDCDFQDKAFAEK